MTPENQHELLQAARTTINLDTVRNLIRNEILPGLAYLKSDDDSLAQTLDLMAQEIDRHFKEIVLK